MAVDPTTRIMTTIFAAEEQSNRDRSPAAISQAVRNGVAEGFELQTIEKALRTANRTVHLIARRPESHFHQQHVQPRLPGDTKNQKYYLYFSSGSCVQRDLFKESQSYEENFAKLKETGFATQISNALLQEQVKKPHEWTPINVGKKDS